MVFAKLYIFALIGLVVNLISDLTYTVGRSADRFRDPGGLTVDARITENAPTPEPSTPRCALGAAPARSERKLFNVSPLNQRRWENFKRNRRG